jgi:hypothetical protein
MSAVDPGFAEYLKARALFADRPSADVSGWGLRDTTESEILSPIALAADAQTEADRQLQVLGKPLAIDIHVVPGRRVDLFGRCITVSAGRLGYQAGQPVFVIGVEPADDGATTRLTVVRAL